jgi:hypothetical protein
MELKGHKQHHHSQKHHRKEGGKVEPALHPKPYNAQGSHVEKEAEDKEEGGEMNKGGRAKKHVHGEHHKAKKHRLDRPGRKRGGRAGAEMNPLSGASKIHDARDHKATEGNSDEGP